MNRGWHLPMVGVVAAVSALALVPTAALACDPGRAHNSGVWLGGRARDIDAPNWWSWINADLDVQDPFVITSLGINSTSYAWVMMTTTSANDHWAQIGPYKDGSNGRADLWQCYDGTTLDNELWPAHPVGSRPTYKVSYGAMGWKYFAINGTPKGSCPYSFTPAEAQAASEIHNEDSQVPGHVSDHEGFVNAQGQGSSGSNHDLFDSASFVVTAYGNPLPSWFNLYKAGTTHQETWDGACP